jgi:hypothetical protein
MEMVSVINDLLEKLLTKRWLVWWPLAASLAVEEKGINSVLSQALYECNCSTTMTDPKIGCNAMSFMLRACRTSNA